MKTIVLTGGGTAGHVMPCLALLPALQKHFDRILFIGGDGMEKDLVKTVPFYSVPTVKFFRRNFFKNAQIPFVLSRGIREAKKILEKYDVSAVFSKGGYASLPACLAARSLDIPVVCHESDYTLGLANKIEGKFAKAVLTSFIETKGGKYVGNPVRKEILSGDAVRARKKYGVKEGKPVLLVVGGSSGADAINKIIYCGLDKLLERYAVVHVSGKTGDTTVKRDGYVQVPFAEDIADLYALSDVVVSRGGSNALSELAALGKKTVVIPLPKGNSRGDQVLNALSYERRGFFSVLLQEDLYVESLLDRMRYAETMPQKKSDVEGINERIASFVAEAARSG